MPEDFHRTASREVGGGPYMGGGTGGGDAGGSGGGSGAAPEPGFMRASWGGGGEKPGISFFFGSWPRFRAVATIPVTDLTSMERCFAISEMEIPFRVISKI